MPIDWIAARSHGSIGTRSAAASRASRTRATKRPAGVPMTDLAVRTGMTQVETRDVLGVAGLTRAAREVSRAPVSTPCGSFK